MNLSEPRLCSVSITTGMLVNGGGHYRKTFRDLSGLYADHRAFDSLLATKADDVAYEVTSHTPGQTVSDLIFGITRMQPGKVGREFYLTRGHIHAVGNRSEIYQVLAGRGVMQMESLDGEVRLIEMRPQDICYVPPYWIHRSINIGDSDLVMFFAYPGDSGQDYGIIERSNGLRVRVLDDGQGGWQQEDNAAWRRRSESEIAAIIAKSEAGV